MCRIRYPEEIVRAYWVKIHPQWEDPSLPVETDEQRLATVAELDKRIAYWDDSYISPIWHHPLDNPEPTHLEFIERKIVSRKFYPWMTFKVTVGKSEHGPMLEEAVATYYHYWQIFLLAEALKMGVSVLINLGDKEVAEKAWYGQLENIAPERKRLTLNVHGWHGIRGILQYVAAFEALAYFLAYQNYALAQATKDKIVNGRFRLSGGPLNAFRKKEEEIAKEAVTRLNVGNEALLSFLKWQCTRWLEWERHGQREITDEYKKNIRETVYLYQILSGKDYDEVVNDMGRVTSHFLPTLEVIFPDWIKGQKKSAEWSLKNWIQPTTRSLSSLGYGISDTECEQLLKWIEKEGQLQFLWHFRQLVDLGEREDPIGLAGVANEVGSLCSTIEHVVNSIGFQHVSFPKKTLFHKMVWLWDLNQDVVNGLNWGKSKGLTSTQNTSLWTTLLDIDTTPDTQVGKQFSPIVRDLLKTILIRNHGTHLSFARFSREEMYQLLEVLLRSFLLIWKQAKVRNLI